MIWDLERAARDAEIALAALDQTGVPFQVGGDIALARHLALQRQAREISVTTPVPHNTDRSRDVVQGALAHLGYRVHIEQRLGQQGLARAMTYLPPEGIPDTADAADALAVRLTISVMPQYNAPAEIGGLRVSSMTTLSIQTLQAVQSRLDPRDFIDLTAQEQHWGRDAFARLTERVLQRAVQDQPPGMDPVEPYLRMTGSLLQIRNIPNIRFSGLGVPLEQVEQVRSATMDMAMRVYVSRPRPKPRDVDAALERLRNLSPGQKAELPTRMAEPEARAALAGRRPSAVPPPPPLPPPTLRPERPAAADSQRLHQQGGPSQHPRQTR
ncbi:hypothetical protein AB0942_34040 [Streptomyces nodosus]|uniref:hypothetical protein n=1 Tax=Streptomyces nodosus TaxID=40318 RepID=UPI00345448CF